MEKMIEIAGTQYVVDMSPEFIDALGAGNIAVLLEQIDLTVERGDLVKLADGTWLDGRASGESRVVVFRGSWDKLNPVAAIDGKLVFGRALYFCSNHHHRRRVEGWKDLHLVRSAP